MLRALWIAALAVTSCKKEGPAKAEETEKPAKEPATAAGGGSGEAEGEEALPEAEASYDGPLPASADGDGWTVRAGFEGQAAIQEVDDEALDKLTVELADAAGKRTWRRAGFHAIAGQAAPRPEFCEQLEVTVEAETWGEVSGARIGLLCERGEDIRSAVETAILLEVKRAADPYKRIWAGQADEAESEMDACVRVKSLTFSVAGATLTKEILEVVERGEDAPPHCEAGETKSSERVQIAR